LNGTHFEGPERTASYQFAIGYIKGTGDVNAGDRTYSIMSTSAALNPTGEHICTYLLLELWALLTYYSFMNSNLWVKKKVMIAR